MICVIKQSANGEITGWMMGVDTHDLRRRAQSTMDSDIWGMFTDMDAPPKGKTLIAPGVTMLVE